MKINTKKMAQPLDPFQAGRPLNPFKAWAASREEKRNREEAEAAKKIANETAYNEKAIADTLLGVSFIHSRLPQEVLNQRTLRENQNDNDPCCDLEHNARELAREITDQQQTLQVDLRSIDQQLLVLAQRFQEAVEKGYKTAAFASMEGLAHGIDEIRYRVPQNNLTFCSQYIEVNTNYLKEWVQLVDLAKGLDLMRENVERRKEDYCVAEEEEKRQIENLRMELKINGKKRKLFEEIYRHVKPEERLRWPNDVRDLYGILIKLRLKQIDLELQYYLMKQEDNRLTSQKGRVDALKEKLNGLPVVQNPNQLNEFQEAMEGMVREMAQLDAELDETLSTMDKIEAQLLQMQNAPGNLRALEAAQQQAEKVVERFREEDEALLDTSRVKSLEEMFGLLSPEQKEQKEQQEQKNQQNQENQQDQYIYN